MDPALAVNLHRALEIGRAQRGQFGVPSTETPLPLQVELLHLDQAIADSMLLQDLTWIDGEAHLVVLQRPHPARPRAGRPHRQHARGRRRHGVSVPHSVLGAPGWYESGNPRARKKKLVLKRPPPPAAIARALETRGLLILWSAPPGWPPLPVLTFSSEPDIRHPIRGPATVIALARSIARELKRLAAAPDGLRPRPVGRHQATTPWLARSLPIAGAVPGGLWDVLLRSSFLLRLGQVENQVGLVRERFFSRRLRVKSYEELNAWLLDRAIAYAKAHRHPKFKDQTIWQVLEAETSLGRRVRSTP